MRNFGDSMQAVERVGPLKLDARTAQSFPNESKKAQMHHNWT